MPKNFQKFAKVGVKAKIRLPIQAHLSLLHGTRELSTVRVNGYSLDLKDRLLAHTPFLGDSVSRSAFVKLLSTWRTLMADMFGIDPLGEKATSRISKSRLDLLLAKKGLAAAVIEAAIEDYAFQMVHVVQQFLQQKSWQGVERIVIGGGFQQSALGRLAIVQTSALMAAQKIPVQLCHLHHDADEGGLIGWVHLLPPELTTQYNALLAVDIGGTNVRCGIVRMQRDKAVDFSRADVIERVKWGHAEDANATRREHLVGGMADMLQSLQRKAEKKGLRLAPFVGISCPGLINADGSLSNGTQNLPGNWESARFHLPENLSQRLPKIDGQTTQVRLHNDAVVQGLSQLPLMEDVKKWAVLTIGTGLGNASFSNRKRPLVF